MFFELDGTFPNHEASLSLPVNLVDLQGEVRKVGADIGLVFDGDTGRCFDVDETGQPVPPSATRCDSTPKHPRHDHKQDTHPRQGKPVVPSSPGKTGSEVAPSLWQPTAQHGPITCAFGPRSRATSGDGVADVRVRSRVISSCWAASLARAVVRKGGKVRDL